VAGGRPRKLSGRGRSAAAAGSRPSDGRPVRESVQPPVGARWRVGAWGGWNPGAGARALPGRPGASTPKKGEWAGPEERGGKSKAVSAGEAGRAARGNQRPIEPRTFSLPGDCTLQFDWAAEREKEISVCWSRRRKKRDSSPQRCGVQTSAKKKRLGVFFCWFYIYFVSTSASLYSMPCPKRSGGDVHFARSAATTPKGMHGGG